MFPTPADEITIKALEAPFFLDELCDSVTGEFWAEFVWDALYDLSDFFKENYVKWADTSEFGWLVSAVVEHACLYFLLVGQKVIQGWCRQSARLSEKQKVSVRSRLPGPFLWG